MLFFCSDQIRTLVAMATYTSHRLIMEKSGNCKFLRSHWRYLSSQYGSESERTTAIVQDLRLCTVTIGHLRY